MMGPVCGAVAASGAQVSRTTHDAAVGSEYWRSSFPISVLKKTPHGFPRCGVSCSGWRGLSVRRLLHRASVSITSTTA